MPNFSYFTYQTPNGNVLGQDGDFAIYKGSASTVTKMWVNMSDNSTVPTTSGWQLLSLLTAVPVVTPTVQLVANPSAATSALSTTVLVVTTSSQNVAVTLPAITPAQLGHQIAIVQEASGVTTTAIPSQSSEKIENASVYSFGGLAKRATFTSGATQWYVTSQSST